MNIIMKNEKFNLLKDNWKLFEDNFNCSPIQYYEYNKRLHNHYYYYIVRYFEKPFFVAFYDNKKCIAIAPLAKRTTLHGTKIFNFGNCPTIAIYDWLYSKDITTEQIEYCIELLKDKYQKIQFNHVNKSSLLYNVLSKKYNIVNTQDNVMINVTNYDDYFNGLSKSSKQNIRTAYNRMTRNNLEFTIEKYAAGEIPATEYKNIMNVYLKRRGSKYKQNNFLRK